MLTTTTAIVDFPGVTHRLAELVTEGGGEVQLGTEVLDLREDSRGVVVSTQRDGQVEEQSYDHVVLCAGLQADRLARMVGASDEPRIMPFRGEYYVLRPERRHLVNGLVYPVPDPRYPFLGIHLTPRVGGDVLVGPNAVLAMAREGYRWTDFSARDLADTFRFPGFMGFARKNLRTGVTEVLDSLSRRRFMARAQRYVPELSADDVVVGPRGIRAQAMDRDGSLVDDFRIDQTGRVTALRNAPSPAATSSLAIADYLVAQINDTHPSLGAT